MVAAGKNKEDIDSILDRLGREFSIHDLGELNFFLGIQVHQQPNAIFLNQQQYLVNLLKNSNFDNLHPFSTPIEANSDLSSSEDIIHNPTKYHHTIGAL